jgi:hypothetical protein
MDANAPLALTSSNVTSGQTQFQPLHESSSYPVKIEFFYNEKTPR